MVVPGVSRLSVDRHAARSERWRKVRRDWTPLPLTCVSARQVRCRRSVSRVGPTGSRVFAGAGPVRAALAAGDATRRSELRRPRRLNMRYRLLGNSGLRVSQAALGTMTFGEDWGWGASKDEARKIYDLYRDADGNFIDTANIYTNGASETFLGEFMRGQHGRHGENDAARSTRVRESHGIMP